MCGLLPFFLVFLCLWSTGAQIAERGVAKKSVVAFDQHETPCCRFSRDAVALYQCIRSLHEEEEPEFNAAIALYTYVTENILLYAGYAVAVNSAYARRRGYSFHIMGFPQQTLMHARPPEEDARWNKVYMLWQAATARVQSNSCIVWLDADLILLDMDMKIEAILAAHAAADIIMSRDIARAEFVSNSGFIIVRSSVWSVYFLEKWWSSFDRRKCCDQNAFTWLYDELADADKNRIAFLRADAINSNFPAWKRQEEHNQVLHLAGASSLLFRAPVFAEGFAQVCSSSSYKKPITHQLGLTATVLKWFVTQTAQTRLAALQTLVQQVQTRRCEMVHGAEPTLTSNVLGCPWHPFPVVVAQLKPSTFLHEVAAVKSILEDILKEDDDDCGSLYQLPHSALKEQEDLLVSLRKWLFESLRLIALERSAEAAARVRPDGAAAVSLPLATLEVLKDAVGAGFEWFLVVQKSTALFPETALKVSHQRPVLNETQQLLIIMEMGSPSNLRAKVLYYKFKHALLTAATHPMLSDDKLRWLSVSVDVWRVLAERNYFGSDYVIADPYKEGSEAMQELGALLCSHQLYNAGIAILAEATSLHEKTLLGYEKIRIAARNDISEGKVALAQTLINAGICRYEQQEANADDLQQAAASLNKAHDLLEQVSANRLSVMNNEHNNEGHYHDVRKAVTTVEEYQARIMLRLATEGVSPPTRLFRRRRKNDEKKQL